MIDEKQVKEFIRQSNMIEEDIGDDPKQHEQSMVAWKMLMEHKGDLTNGLICRVQKVISLLQNMYPGHRGYYRDLMNYEVQVGGHIAPSSYMVPFLMDNWLIDYGNPKKDFDPKEAHIRFERIHPFADGNGRTGRMLLNWHRLQKDLPLLIIDSKTKYTDYYPWFER
jgi:Fic family protein